MFAMLAQMTAVFVRLSDLIQLPVLKRLDASADDIRECAHPHAPGASRSSIPLLASDKADALRFAAVSVCV